MTRLLLLAGVFAMGSGCILDSGSCTLELRSAVGGAVVDAADNPIEPTAVTSSVGGVVEPCDVFEGGYTCYERGPGNYRIRVEVDGFVDEAEFELAEDEDGCHIAGSAQHDVVVP